MTGLPKLCLAAVLSSVFEYAVSLPHLIQLRHLFHGNR